MANSVTFNLKAMSIGLIIFTAIITFTDACLPTRELPELNRIENSASSSQETADEGNALVSKTFRQIHHTIDMMISDLKALYMLGDVTGTDVALDVDSNCIKPINS